MTKEHAAAFKRVLFPLHVMRPTCELVCGARNGAPPGIATWLQFWLKICALCCLCTIPLPCAVRNLLRAHGFPGAARLSLLRVPRGTASKDFGDSLKAILALAERYPAQSHPLYILRVFAQFLPALLMPCSRRGKPRHV
jgi:hypothetical protein